ncbi:MAG: EAL domain-containing protein [Rhodococcus sp. (in: high G+C Gram-positive bacteria)]
MPDDAVRERSSHEAISAALADVIAVRPVFQPVVELGTGTVVGYEALARWPELPRLDIDSVFAKAADLGTVDELDWACRTGAIDAALAADMPEELCLFVNVEPHTGTRPTDAAKRAFAAAEGRLTVVLELTERSLLADPAVLLAVVAEGRRAGCRIALDDVSVHPDTVTMLEFVAPDIIKLDRSLVQHDPNRAQARVIAAVRAHSEATEATVLAEGIENDEHLARAHSLGAKLGQGWLFGRPGPLPESVRTAPGALSVLSEPDPKAGLVPNLPSDLFELMTPTIGTKSFIRAISRQIEDHARDTNDSLALMSTFQHSRWFSPPVAEQYAFLANKHPFVAAVGVGLGGEPAPGVRGADLDPAEEFTREWTITAVGQHYFSALIARDLGDTECADADRRFEFVHTHNRQLVVAAARSLMRRIIPV